MNDLLMSCTDNLQQAETPVCGDNFGERVTQVVLSKAAITQAGNVPTPNEFHIAYIAGEITVIGGITNGHKVFLNETEIEGVYGKEWYDKQYRVEGRIKRVSEAIGRMCEKLTRYETLKLWYITDGDYCFGSYDCSPSFSLLIQNQIIYIDFKLDFTGNGIDYSNYHPSYEDVRGILGGIIYPGVDQISYPGVGIIHYP
ncbi:MAG TPA: hypothetical protein ENH82_14120 [bacterium]|nr:hypothetical protein [bacterium]